MLLAYQSCDLLGRRLATDPGGAGQRSEMGGSAKTWLRWEGGWSGGGQGREKEGKKSDQKMLCNLPSVNHSRPSKTSQGKSQLQIQFNVDITYLSN